MESKKEQKLRGGFYTPAPIAEFLANWAVKEDSKSILEPSCGDGRILEAIQNRVTRLSSQRDRNLIGVEFVPEEAQKARERIDPMDGLNVEIEASDFFKYCIENTRWHKSEFDAVVGNPPFIRYQDFPDDQRERALQILTESGLSETRQMNAWMPFLIGATQLLSDHGRLSMVAPASLLQVNYAGELREFLIEEFSHLTVVTFSELVFDDVLEEVVLVLGERNGEKKAGMRLVELEDMDDLGEYKYSDFTSTEVKDVNHSTEKWTLYYLSQEQIDLIREFPERQGVDVIDDYADVNVGVVTGRNEFFLQSRAEEEEREITEFTRPIVTRSAHLGEGVQFTHEEYQQNLSTDKKTRLLNLPEISKSELPDAAQRYIDSGEEKDFHNGYKTGLRDFWYTVPSTWVPSGFLLRHIHDYPKFVHNSTETTCTDTIHRVNYTGSEAQEANFFAATHNSLTWAFSEFIGRSYGGGILELEPNEAEELPVPTNNWEDIDLDEVDRLLREKGPQAVLEYTDEILLEDGLGLSEEEIKLLRDIWRTLQDRRLNRSR